MIRETRPSRQYPERLAAPRAGLRDGGRGHRPSVAQGGLWGRSRMASRADQRFAACAARRCGQRGGQGVADKRTTPNEGIHRSARHGVLIGLVSGLTFGLFAGLVSMMLFGTSGESTLAWTVGLAGGLIAGGFGGLLLGIGGGLAFGGNACLPISPCARCSCATVPRHGATSASSTT
jgi:hypothetical protein